MALGPETCSCLQEQCSYPWLQERSQWSFSNPQDHHTWQISPSGLQSDTQGLVTRAALRAARLDGLIAALF